MHSDISKALDEALIILDLFAGFDVIDYPILLELIEVSFGTKEDILTWTDMYLTDKNHCILVAGNISSDTRQHFGTSQRSDL